jgi:hypothetical protein
VVQARRLVREQPGVYVGAIPALAAAQAVGIPHSAKSFAKMSEIRQLP